MTAVTPAVPMTAWTTMPGYWAFKAWLTPPRKTPSDGCVGHHQAGVRRLLEDDDQG
jgi:hypothetical protein